MDVSLCSSGHLTERHRRVGIGAVISTYTATICSCRVPTRGRMSATSSHSTDSVARVYAKQKRKRRTTHHFDLKP